MSIGDVYRCCIAWRLHTRTRHFAHQRAPHLITCLWHASCLDWKAGSSLEASKSVAARRRRSSSQCASGRGVCKQNIVSTSSPTQKGRRRANSRRQQQRQQQRTRGRRPSRPSPVHFGGCAAVAPLSADQRRSAETKTIEATSRRSNRRRFKHNGALCGVLEDWRGAGWQRSDRRAYAPTLPKSRRLAVCINPEANAVLAL